MLLDNCLNCTQLTHDRKLEQHVVLLGRIIIHKADWLESKPRICDQLLCNELRGITGANDQGGTAGIGTAPPRVFDSDCSGKESGQSDGGCTNKRVNEDHREGNSADSYLACGQ